MGQTTEPRSPGLELACTHTAHWPWGCHLTLVHCMCPHGRYWDQGRPLRVPQEVMNKFTSHGVCCPLRTSYSISQTPLPKTPLHLPPGQRRLLSQQVCPPSICAICCQRTGSKLQTKKVKSRAGRRSTYVSVSPRECHRTPAIFLKCRVRQTNALKTLEACFGRELAPPLRGQAL